MIEVFIKRGAHNSPKDGACVMEYVSWIAGEEWSDSPPCTHPMLASAARLVNDSVPDDERQKLKDLIPLLMNTRIEDETKDKRVSVRCAIWCAEKVLHLVRSKDRKVYEDAIQAAKDWVAEPCEATANAANAAASAASASAAAAAYAANAASAYAAYAAAYASAAASAYANAANAKIDLLKELCLYFRQVCKEEGVELHDPLQLNELHDSIIACALERVS